MCMKLSSWFVSITRTLEADIAATTIAKALVVAAIHQSGRMDNQTTRHPEGRDRIASPEKGSGFSRARA